MCCIKQFTPQFDKFMKCETKDLPVIHAMRPNMIMLFQRIRDNKQAIFKVIFPGKSNRQDYYSTMSCTHTYLLLLPSYMTYEGPRISPEFPPWKCTEINGFYGDYLMRLHKESMARSLIHTCGAIIIRGCFDFYPHFVLSRWADQSIWCSACRPVV